ncbi:MAG TPA: LPS export ABC transporter permease LptF [Thermoanaerobaculia bacterium]|nr:LPS export ABC transporter permease LptF [Thermoanaerobaculia bacterium]
MHILTRYIIREMIGPTLLGFAFYTFIILMRNLFDFAEMIIERSLPLTTVFRLLALSLPNIIVLTVPMSLLFGILIAVGRLSSDSEIIAMQSAGVAMRKIYRPVLYFSLGIFLVNLYLMNFVLPQGNTALQGLQRELFTASAERAIQPRVFYDQIENLLIYVNDVTPDGRWKGVFVSDTTDPENQNIIVASSGSLSLVEKEKQLWLDLEDVRTHVVTPGKAEQYRVSSNASQRFLLTDRFGETRSVSTAKLYRSMTLTELFEQHRRADIAPIDRRIIQVEIHKKFSFPFACLSFGILGLPLGISNRRGGRSSGFTLSIGIILFYYILINNGEEMAIAGSLHPALAMWLPNIVLILFGMYLIQRTNSDRSGRLAVLMERAGVVLRRVRFRRTNGQNVIEERPSIASRLDIAFPNILDRYILRQFVTVLMMVLISTIVLFVVIEYSEIAGHIAANQIGFDIVASFFRYFILQVLSLTLPISVLMGTLITFGILSKNNEVTALKANGVSLYRAALPIVAIAGFMCALSYLLLDFVLPYSNQKVDALENQIKGRVTVQSFSLQQKQWLWGKGRYLFNFLPMDRSARTLTQVQVFEFDEEDFRVTRRTYADEARFDGVGWVFVNGWMRSFGDDGSASYSPIINPIRLHFPERPEYFSADVKSPVEMTYGQLRTYIRNLESAGYATEELKVELYKKTSWPFVSLVMALIALPFSFKIGKRGALYGVGVALFLAFLYWTVFGVFTQFGAVGNLPAILSAWSANILFAIAAVYMFLQVET